MRRLVAWLSRQRVPAAAMPMAQPGREAAWLLGLAALHVLAALLAGLAIRHHPLRIAGATDWLQDWWYAGAFKTALMLALPLLLLRRWGSGPRDLLAGWKPTLGSLGVVALAYAAGFSLNLGRLASIRVHAGMLDPPEAAARLLAGLGLALATAAVPEELVYRGMLQTRLERVAGRVPALLLAAVLFTAWHVPSRYLNANGVEGVAGDLGSVLVGTALPVLAIALILGWSWDRHRNLPALVAAHWGVDTLPIVASMLQCPPR